MAAHLAFHLGEYAFALRQCQKAFENKASVPAVQQEDLLVDTVQDFFTRVGHETTDVSSGNPNFYTIYQVFTRPKGQKVLKAIYGSPEKRTNKTERIGPNSMIPQVKFFTFVFERIEDTIICFQDLLTFNKI